MKKMLDFNRETYEKKKDILITIVEQLTQEYQGFQDTLFLLQVSNKIKENTLDTIYQDIFDLIENGKNLSRVEYGEKVKIIQSKIKNEELEQEQDEADAELLLCNLD